MQAENDGIWHGAWALGGSARMKRLFAKKMMRRSACTLQEGRTGVSLTGNAAACLYQTSMAIWKPTAAN